ncbi:hypothetical protein [Streptococcus pneumoniae]|uniref:hypothetical protein n=1 Tax=Streptococcus pneumoniae TaxID=1313 RepID=UPI0005E4D4F2|nr:hypothetical protein [Streptococcus pneumoniae]CKJ89818.1 chlorohydrolase [Streptococcus pneumoniae]
MKIKDQTRKLATGCSKHCFEVVDKTDEVSSKHVFSKHSFEVVDRTDEAQNTVLRLQIELTKSVTSIRQGDVDAV